MELILHSTRELINIIHQPAVKAITGYASTQIVNSHTNLFKDCEIYAYAVNSYNLRCKALYGIEYPPLKLYLTRDFLYISSASLTLHEYAEITVKMQANVSACEHFLANLVRIPEPVLTPML